MAYRYQFSNMGVGISREVSGMQAYPRPFRLLRREGTDGHGPLPEYYLLGESLGAAFRALGISCLCTAYVRCTDRQDILTSE